MDSNWRKTNISHSNKTDSAPVSLFNNFSIKIGRFDLARNKNGHNYGLRLVYVPSKSCKASCDFCLIADIVSLRLTDNQSLKQSKFKFT